MRLRLLFSIWTAVALLSLGACEFHAEAGSPPATPSSTPSPSPVTNPTAAAATAAPAPASTLPTNSVHTGHIQLQHDDAGA